MGGELRAVAGTFPAQFGKPFLGGVEPCDSGYGRCSDFYPVGVFLRVKFRDRVHAGTAGFHVPYVDALADDHTAYTHRPEQAFVPGKDQYVDSPLIHVNRDYTSGLTGVDNEDCGRVLDDLTDGLDIL